MKVEGTFTALVTPFTPDGLQVDYEKLRELTEWQIQVGVNGLVVLGSTGEHQAVTFEERMCIIHEVVKTTNKRVPVVAGTGSNSTATAITLTQAAKDAGADGCMVVSPYYNTPTQRGLYEHFKAVAQVGLPVILYNNPGRAMVNIEPQTVAKLAKVPGIVAIKDATGGLDQMVEISALCDLTIFCGEDTLALPMMAIGATGVMSILSNIGTLQSQDITADGVFFHSHCVMFPLIAFVNCVLENVLCVVVAPERVLALTNAAMQGDFVTARRAHLENFFLVKSLFIESNPSPTKQMLALLGKCSASVRAPLVPCSKETVELLRQQLEANNLL